VTLTLAPGTFWLRIFWSVVPVVAVFLIFQAVMSGRAHWQLVTDEFNKRGQTIAGQLASSVELGVYSEDRQLLGASIRGALKNPDVAYVVIYGESGRVLADGGRLSKDVLAAEPAVAEVTSSRRAERGGEQFIEFRAPVTVEETRTAEEELVRQGAAAVGATKRIGALTVGLSLRGVEEQFWGLLTLWAGTTVGFLALSALALSTFSRRITRPINRLTEQAGKVAAGRLDETISVESRDEIGQLAVAFNEMTRSLKLSTGEKEQALTDLRDLNRTLEERIERRTTELRERGRDLQRSLEEVRAMGEISQAVASTLDPATVLNTISARAVGLSGSDVCAIFERDPAQGRLAGVAFYDAPEDFVKALRTGAGGSSEQLLLPIRQAMETGETVQVPDIPAERPATPFEWLHARAGFRALLVVPMAGGDVARAMVVYRRAAGAFDDRAVALLTTLANQSKIALDNARLFKELADKSRQLEVASRHKSDFLASVSHELRTPLNAILGFNELILGEVYGEVPPDLKVPLTDVQNSGRHLLGLINNVLDLSKIEAGRMELALSDYLVSDVVESVRNSLRSLATAKGLELDTLVTAGITLAHGDPGRITQSLMNLAGNALKFTSRGRILITVEPAGAMLHFRVADTGIGIAPDRLATVFDEFRQGDVTIAREFGGTGLGLSITRKFVEMHGGRVWVESELGKGSTFAFAIPLRVEAGRTS
jgi:signal transduction histidine kinase/HAMP domain-containing protein